MLYTYEVLTNILHTLNSLLKTIKIKHILIVSFLIRFVLLPLTFHGDVTVTYWWGKFASEFRLRGFYDWLNFGGYGLPDQPMINIYYNWFVREIYLVLHSFFWYLNITFPLFPSKFMQWFFLNGNQILLKLPMIIADIGLIYISYKFIEKNFSIKKAKIISLILCFYLPMIYNSALWGSGDSIINFFALMGIYFFYNHKEYKGVLFFIISILYKASLLIWSPLLLIILIKNKRSFFSISKLLIFTLSLLYIICLPFTPIEINPIFWFFKTMLTKILPGAMNQITVNSFNFWAIFFGLTPITDNFLIFNLISTRNLSLIICFILILLICINLYKKYSPKNLLLSLVNITLITFIFMTRMHERYTFPALLPLLLLIFFDKSYIKYFLILSITHLLNVYNWWWYPKIPILIFFLKQPLVITSLSILNTIITLVLIKKQIIKINKTKT